MYSARHRTIFVHIPKCAGQSVETAFLADEGLTWENRAPLLLRFNPDPRLGPPRLAHLLASDYVARGHVDQATFDACFKFAIVRDPWSRAVSLYRHLQLNMPFSAFVTKWLPAQFSGPGDQFWFVRPQADFLYTDGKLLVDMIVPFENLAAAFPAAAERAGLRTPLPRVNTSKGAPKKKTGGLLGKVWNRHESRDDWRSYYTGDLADRIGALYAADASAFGYSSPA
ncbi:MAG: sulfotransferase family protein [Nitratireductor sp.]|jgi:hypothetical protein|nr:sulfotransferase family protein [Nitratireductor sp.]